MSTFAIIMSTYNGHQYITQQIQSILAQTYRDFTLFVRDDGSSDDTFQILKDFASNDSRIHLVKDNPSSPNPNLGFGESFSRASKYALSQGEFSFFAFCDQDDYWEPEKLQVTFENISGITGPALFSSNFYVCDSTLNILHTFSKTTPLTGVTFENLIFEGALPGFSITINRPLAVLAFDNEKASKIYYHDKWVHLIQLGLGGSVIYSDKPLAKYRRHSDAISSTNRGPLAKLKWRVDNVLNGDYCPRTRDMIYSYKELFFDKLPKEGQRFLRVFTSGSRLRKVFYPHRLRRSISGEILLRLIFILGKL